MNDYKYISLKKSVIEFNTYINKKIILCGTHNNRLECFLNNININNNYPNKSFNNCVIIKCYRERDNTKFKMIYEGETYNGTSNIVSLCSNPLGKANRCWDIVSFNIYFNNYSYDINLPVDTEIYLIRHGLGVHNKMNILQKFINAQNDPPLDVIGIEQAKRAGIFLNGYFKNFYKNINIIFTASHLIRTQQTIAEIIKVFNNKDSIYIIPCIHEISFSNSCDTSLLNKIQLPSNSPNCTSNEGSCSKLNDININWNYYMNFNNKCQDTNMINIILDFLTNSQLDA